MTSADSEIVSGVAVGATTLEGKYDSFKVSSFSRYPSSLSNSTLSVSTGTGNSADFYVYTKSTAVGTVSITRAGTTTVYYVQGQAGALNSIALSAPTSGAAGTVATLKVTGYDVFGNPKGGATIAMGRFLGYSREAALRYSFLLAWHKNELYLNLKLWLTSWFLNSYAGGAQNELFLEFKNYGPPHNFI